jgi:integrase
VPPRRARSTGSVYFDKANQTWWARVSLGKRDGRPYGKKARAPSRDAALAELEQLNRLYVAGGTPARQTLDEYLTEWHAGHKGTVRASTAVSYAGHINLHISPLLGGIMVAKLRPADVRRLIAELHRKKLSPATIGRIVTTLRMALAQGVRERSLADNAAAGVALPRVEHEPVRALTEATATAIIDATANTFIGDLVVLLLGSGLRVGEALGLDWRDVGEGFVVVRRSKTKVRAVPISADAVEALERHRKASRRYGPDVPVFLMQRRARKPENGDRLPVATVTHAFPRILEVAGLPRMRVHDLRHGVATLMVARGVHMRLIAQQLGHADPAITARTYAHVLPEQAMDSVQVLNRRKA